MTIYETYKYIYTGVSAHIPCKLAGAEYNCIVWNPIGLLHPANFAISDQLKQAGYMVRIPHYAKASKYRW